MIPLCRVAVGGLFPLRSASVGRSSSRVKMRAVCAILALLVVGAVAQDFSHIVCIFSPYIVGIKRWRAARLFLFDPKSRRLWFVPPLLRMIFCVPLRTQFGCPHTVPDKFCILGRRSFLPR
jgi:hypothetical protein